MTMMKQLLLTKYFASPAAGAWRLLHCHRKGIVADTFLKMSAIARFGHLAVDAMLLVEQGHAIWSGGIQGAVVYSLHDIFAQHLSLVSIMVPFHPGVLTCN